MQGGGWVPQKGGSRGVGVGHLKEKQPVVCITL